MKELELPVSQLVTHVRRTLLVAVEVALKEIREKEHLQYGEHDEELDEDDNPERTAYRHAAEAVDVEADDFPDGVGRGAEDVGTVAHSNSVSGGGEAVCVISVAAWAKLIILFLICN